jgi:hypothetical protein
MEKTEQIAGQLFAFLDEKETPYLNKMERIVITIHLFGICTMKQLETVTGWSRRQIQDALNRLRSRGAMVGATTDLQKQKEKEEKDKWLRFWRLPDQTYAYALGKYGLEWAVSLRKESMGSGYTKKKPHAQGHAAHFLGFNNILCRLLDAGIPIEEWMVGKEVMSYLFYEFKERQTIKGGGIETKKIKFLPFRPDGLLRVHDHVFFLEYDTGSESNTKLKERLDRYFIGYSKLKPHTHHTVIWVTVSERRKKRIEEAGAAVYETYKNEFGETPTPQMCAFVEGEETEFFQLKRPPFFFIQ